MLLLQTNFIKIKHFFNVFIMFYGHDTFAILTLFLEYEIFLYFLPKKSENPAIFYIHKDNILNLLILSIYFF